MMEHVITENRGRYTAIGALLIFLFRSRYPNRLDVSIRIGREYTQMGRVVKVIVNMLVQMFGHMVTDGIGVWATYFDRAARVIKLKMGTQDHEVKGRVCCFVGGTLRPHYRPAGDVAQAATYLGFKRNHVIKFQGVVLPNGIIADLWGPTAGRRHGGYHEE
ncbi:unnamed protein product [Discosporangium mesarthrocarpum]